MSNMFNPLEFLRRKRYQRAARRLGMTGLFRFQYDDKKIAGKLKNISLHGFGFSTTMKLDPGREIRVEITLDFANVDQNLLEPEMEQFITLREKSIIKWVRPNRFINLGNYDVGCRFLNADIEKMKILRRI